MKTEHGGWQTRVALLALIMVLVFHSRLGAQDFSVGFSGYLKNLGIRSESLLTGEAYFLDVSRVRAKGMFDFGDRIHAEVWLDNELLAGNFLATPDFKLREFIQRPVFLDLDWTVADGDKYELRQSLFRAFATVYAGTAEVTIGRQRIAWGAGFVWNPTDLLNPFNPTAIELDEKEGVDAVYAVLPSGTFLRLEAAFAPGRDDLKSRFAGRVTSHVGKYDFSFMAGDFQDDFVVGGDFAGYIGGAGLRGEFAYTWKEGDDNFVRAVLNADYNLPWDVYAFGEFYYNGQGASDKEDYDFTALFFGETFNLAQLYVAGSANKAVTPLFSVSLYSILNLNDGSRFFGPAVIYSLATNLEFSGSVYVFSGADGSEYGLLETTVFGYLQYYF